MQENNEKDTPVKNSDSETDFNNVETVKLENEDTTPPASENEDTLAAVEESRPNEGTGLCATYGFKKCLVAGLAILVIGLGLLFILEKEGRVSTGIFSAFTQSAVAIVNGVDINKADFDSSLNQLLQMAAAQGADASDTALVANYKTQALDTLVNGELLRQAALEAGIEATADVIDTRYAEIRDGIGGEEPLKAKMKEFGISVKVLRRDIENEILIQGLFEDVIETDKITVSEEEVVSFYEKLGGEDKGLPALNDVRAQIEEQIKLDKQGVLVNAYIAELRSKAEIETLI